MNNWTEKEKQDLYNSVFIHGVNNGIEEFRKTSNRSKNAIKSILYRLTSNGRDKKYIDNAILNADLSGDKITFKKVSLFTKIKNFFKSLWTKTA